MRHWFFSASIVCIDLLHITSFNWYFKANNWSNKSITFSENVNKGDIAKQLNNNLI